MAFGRRRGYGAGRGYYTRGGPAAAVDEDQKDWTPKVDKNPYYRTMDILNGVFKRNLKLEAGKCNSYDGKIISVNFGESRWRPIVELRGPGQDDAHSVYRFDCGHDWEGKAGHPVDGSKKGPCWVCGAQQSYLGFEHEWQHSIFKSDLIARVLFVDQYADQLRKQTPHVDEIELKNFLALFINAFDDIRCNSLWEKVYPGSAAAIWERWKRLTEERADEVSEDFLSFIFAVAFGVPTDPQGEFEPLRPVIEWGLAKVKYRGFSNMLVDIRVVLDRCMGALMSRVPPPQPAMPQQGQPQQQQGGSSGNQSTQEGSPGSDRDEDAGGAGGPTEVEPDGDNGGARGGDEEGGSSSEAPRADSPPAPTHIPSADLVQATPQERAEALKKLMADAKALDEKEAHPEAGDELKKDGIPQSAMAMVAQALGKDIQDLQAVDQALPDQLDQDMQQALDQLQNGMVNKSGDSQLTSGAKARILLVDVFPEGVRNDSIELSEDERFAVSRMRSAFYKTLGRQKAKRSVEGNVVDVQAAIQYLSDHQDPEVFENDVTQQGFAYAILCDMSGSMDGSFRNVCHAAEMLKQALDFPFVIGKLWGFRGGEDIPGRKSETAEVWMYRYMRACRGYTGITKLSSFIPHLNRFNRIDVPVRCGGLTPMNSAINVAVTDLWRRMPASMAKRLFLLTDGSPCHHKVNGQGLPEWMLRSFVAKEINLARQHGVQVYTIVIGEHSIEDDECKKMFGARQFWRKTEQSQVYKELRDLVLANFTRYIKARG
jgi:hypothetical protein